MKNDFSWLSQTMIGMTYEEVVEAVRNNALVLFPVGVIEAHGPHLLICKNERNKNENRIL